MLTASTSSINARKSVLAFASGSLFERRRQYAPEERALSHLIRRAGYLELVGQIHVPQVRIAFLVRSSYVSRCVMASRAHHRICNFSFLLKPSLVVLVSIIIGCYGPLVLPREVHGTCHGRCLLLRLLIVRSVNAFG